MREFTKSMMSYTWAMSLFGVQQMFNALRPSKAAESFDNVTEATEEELGRSLRSAFRAGDDLQRRLLDIMFCAGGSCGDGRRADANASRGQTAQGAGQVGRQQYQQQQYQQQQQEQYQQQYQQQQGASTPPPYGSTPAPPPQTPSPARTGGGAGWGAMPVSGTASPRPQPAPQQGRDDGRGQRGELPHEPDISSDYPFEPRYVEVLGSRMHYVEQGTGETVVFLHGNPTWSYLWRNIIPHLSPHARCIAPDLMGYGRSDKPDIEYRWAQQARYFEEFIKKLGLKNVTLVLHDWGVSVGLNYALRHESNVRAIAFFEGIFKTFPRWEDFSTPEFRALFQKFREGGEGGEGWQLLVEQNFFIEELLSGGVGRRLSEAEMRYYREPFRETGSRIPIWRLARSVPVAGEPREVWDGVNDITERLKRSKLPKLLFYATPGGLVTAEYVDWCRQNLKNLETVSVGAGLHYLQETSPRLIGSELADWYKRLPRGR